MVFNRRTFVRSGQRRSRLGIFLPLALPFAILAGVAVFAALTPYRHTTGPPPGTPGALVWGDGLFANTSEVKAWLTLHGASYREWERHHPAAMHLVTRHAVKPPHRRATTATVHRAGAATKRHRSAPNLPAAAAKPTIKKATQNVASGRFLDLIILFVSISLLALVSAMLTARLLKRLAPSPQVAEMRIALAATGAARNVDARPRRADRLASPLKDARGVRLRYELLALRYSRRQPYTRVRASIGYLLLIMLTLVLAWILMMTLS